MKYETRNTKYETNSKFERLNSERFRILGIGILILFSISILGFSISALAANQQGTISPPLITLVPRDLGNNEIWYIGGTASVPETDIIIYLQGQDGETQSFTAKSNEKGEWFYTHSSFLKEGKYKSWAQLKVLGELSPPGPEVSFEIIATALRIGSYRISFEILYMTVALILFGILVVLALVIFYHFRHYHIKNARLRREIREAEEEARKGFDILRRDIKEELEFIARIKKSQELTIEEHRREEKLMHDLDVVERHMMKEIKDIEPAMP